MNRAVIRLDFLVLTALTIGVLITPHPVDGQTLSATFEQIATDLAERTDAFGVETCDAPCFDGICCDDGVCADSVGACGRFPIRLDSFRIHGSPDARMAGFATQGVLAAAPARPARLWFGTLDGEAWRRRGVEPGTYELTLEAGANPDRAIVLVTGEGGRPVARLGGHFWVFSGPLDNIQALEWNLFAGRLTFRACHEARCVQLVLDLAT